MEEFEENAATEEVKIEKEIKEVKNSKEKKSPKATRVKYILLAVFIGIACFFGGFFTYRWTLDKELRSLIRLKDTIQQEYYEEVTDEAFYGAIFTAVNEAVKNGDCRTEEEFYDVVFDAVNEDLLDPYSEYMTAEEYAAMRVQATGAQSGTGIYFLSGTNDLIVKRVAGNSPAEETGLVLGDVIIGCGKIGGEITLFNNRADYSAFLRNIETNEDFIIQWRTSAGETRTGTCRKAVYVENYVYYKTNASSYGYRGELLNVKKEVGEPLDYLSNDTAYIKIVQFNGNAGEAFDKAMLQFRLDGKKNLVLDLRGNGGGYIELMQDIAKYFCKKSKELFPLAATADYGEKKQYFNAKANLYDTVFDEDSRITVLADNMTASASECLIGCMYAYDAIGYEDICLVEEADGRAKTYGKGIMQSTFKLGDEGEAVRLTTAKIYWPTEEPHCIHGVGVTKEDGAKTVSYALNYEEQTHRAIQTLFA